MADTLLQAIQTRFESSTARALVAARLYFAETPAADKDNLPYVTLAHDGAEIVDWTFETDYTEDEGFTFFVFGLHLPTVERIATEIKKSFDLPGTTEANAALAVSGMRIIGCYRQGKGYNLGVKPERSKDDNLVYAAELVYVARVKHTLGTN